jgi:hypothetical protein
VAAIAPQIPSIVQLVESLFGQFASRDGHLFLHRGARINESETAILVPHGSRIS